MKNLLKIHWIVTVIIVAIVISLSVAVMTGAFSKKSNYDKFAICLDNAGLTMYGTDWCSACDQQKEMFGDAFKYIDYENCDFNQEECRDLGITGYPAWVLDDEVVGKGSRPFADLAGFSGCTLPLGN